MLTGRLIIATAVLGIGLTAAAEPKAAVYLGLNRWNWSESEGGRKLLEESGPLLNLGVSARVPMNDALFVDVGGDLFVGVVDYDGAAFDGAATETTTRYFGAESRIEALWRATPNAAVRALPFAGIGLRLWNRDIQDADALTLGYEEDWLTLFASLGIRVEGDLDNGCALFGVLALRHALWNRAEYGFQDLGLSMDPSVEPGGDLSWRAEGGLTRGRFRVSVLYEQLRFGRSNSVEIGGGVRVWQPESEADVLGLQVGMLL